MKGQQQIVSVVIIIGLIIGATATVLPWANTMIQKKKDMKSLDDVYYFFQNMDETIRTIAKNGGEESLSLETPGILIISPENNTISFNFESKVSNIAEGDWIPLNTPNLNETGTLGLDTPSVIFGKAEKQDNIIKIWYKLWYRELKDPSTGQLYKISLNTTDGKEKSTTTGYIRIQKIGTTTSEDLTITKINIII